MHLANLSYVSHLLSALEDAKDALSQEPALICASHVDEAKGKSSTLLTATHLWR